MNACVCVRDLPAKEPVGGTPWNETAGRRRVCKCTRDIQPRHRPHLLLLLQLNVYNTITNRGGSGGNYYTSITDSRSEVSHAGA